MTIHANALFSPAGELINIPVPTQAVFGPVGVSSSQTVLKASSRLIIIVCHLVIIIALQTSGQTYPTVLLTTILGKILS